MLVKELCSKYPGLNCELMKVTAKVTAVDKGKRELSLEFLEVDRSNLQFVRDVETLTFVQPVNHFVFSFNADEELDCLQYMVLNQAKKTIPLEDSILVLSHHTSERFEGMFITDLTNTAQDRDSVGLFAGEFQIGSNEDKGVTVFPTINVGQSFDTVLELRTPIASTDDNGLVWLQPVESATGTTLVEAVLFPSSSDEFSPELRKEYELIVLRNDEWESDLESETVSQSGSNDEPDTI